MGILSEMKKHNEKLVSDTVEISRELIRTAILLKEMWK